MAPHSSTLAWKIPWAEEPGRLQSMGSLRVGHDWATSPSLFTFMHWSRKWQPTPGFLPGESQGRGSLVGCRLWGRTESDTTEATQQQQPHPSITAAKPGAITASFHGSPAHVLGHSIHFQLFFTLAFCLSHFFQQSLVNWDQLIFQEAMEYAHASFLFKIVSEGCHSSQCSTLI